MVASTTPDQLRRCLREVDFPANKQDLLEAARRTGCDEETLRALRTIPRETYTHVGQITASVTIVDDRGVEDGDGAAAVRSHTEPGRGNTATDIGPQKNPIADEPGDNRGP